AAMRDPPRASRGCAGPCAEPFAQTIMTRSPQSAGGRFLPISYGARSYFDLPLCLAQRLRCASAIRLRASGLSVRRFLPFSLADAFFALGAFTALAATL